MSPGADELAAPTDGLLERGAETAALEGMLEAVRGGEGRMALLDGEAGSGKTALIDSFCRRAAGSLRLLRGGCDPLFTPRPLGPLIEVAEATGGELQRLVEESSQPFEVASALLRELQGARPVVLVLEDANWADEATLDVIRLLGRRVAEARALVVVSFRGRELSRAHPLRVLLGEIATADTVTRIQLEPLSAAAVASLARPHGIDADELHRRTGGNPFFVTEVLASGQEEIPVTAREAVLARAARLPEQARLLLEAVAVVPQQTEIWLLEALAGDAIDELERCLEAGMLASEAGGVAFHHELAREAIEQALPAHRRAELHRVALTALAQPPHGDPDLARLAHHAEASGDVGAVLRYAPAAGERAATLGLTARPAPSSRERFGTPIRCPIASAPSSSSGAPSSATAPVSSISRSRPSMGRSSAGGGWRTRSGRATLRSFSACSALSAVRGGAPSRPSGSFDPRALSRKPRARAARCNLRSHLHHRRRQSPGRWIGARAR